MMDLNGVNASNEEAGWYGVVNNALGAFASVPSGEEQESLNFGCIFYCHK